MSIFIPNKINVGYQNRKDTYTGKLAYIIYYDERGKLRKETSWQNWRDTNIPNNEYDNVPTDGFVLNKKVGGYKSGWDFRQTYARVYDPRGFEFEITVPNLLWILECCNCIKGKGLEGEFVYGWEGSDLLLIPVDSPDYQKIITQSKAIQNNSFVKGSELKVGALYRDRNNTEYIYLGRYNYYEKERNYKINKSNSYGIYRRNNELIWKYPLDDTWKIDLCENPNYYRYKYELKGKGYWFAQICSKYGSDEKYFSLIHPRGISKRFIETDVNVGYNFQLAYEEMTKHEEFSPIDFSRQEIIYIPYNVFEKAYTNYPEQGLFFYFSRYENEEFHTHCSIRYDKKRQVYYCGSGNEYHTIKEIYDKFKPCVIKQYLENNKYVIRGYNYGYEE